MSEDYSIKEHLNAIEDFMLGAGQCVRLLPGVPSPEERILRAKLIWEEARETIEALGVDHILGQFIDAGAEHYDPVAVLDGCADIAVVTNGTLLSCGLAEVFPEALRRVDINNLSKINGNHSFREDGKLIKPSDYIPVNLKD